MAFESTGRSEFAKLMADHIFSDVNRYVLSAVVNSDCVSNKARQDCRCTGPGLDDFLFFSLVQRVDLLFQRESDERAFLTDLDNFTPPYLTYVS